MQQGKNAVSRRQALGLVAVTATGGVFLPRAAFAQANASTSPLLIPDAGVCRITPKTTAGPFYFDPELVRTDITEEREGVPLAVRLQIVDAACAPLPGARVDIWHCDAMGLYSGYPGQGDDRVDTSGQKFLRGTQMADERGLVSFATIYPGWYPGRTPHIHFTVFIAEDSVLTGQIFFPDGLSEYLFLNVEPYSARSRSRDTWNADDGIARRAGPASHASLREVQSAYDAAMIIAVDPAG
jgi:protocatechuate 3,4-dioxygenase beta subunit